MYTAEFHVEVPTPLKSTIRPTVLWIHQLQRELLDKLRLDPSSVLWEREATTSTITHYRALDRRSLRHLATLVIGATV